MLKRTALNQGVTLHAALLGTARRVRGELCPSQQEVLPHAVTVLTFSKDTSLTVPNSSARIDHRRRAERLLPSPSAAESNQPVSARINAPWHRAANTKTH